MYDAKAAGRDACRFYEPDARDSEERLELAARLRQAIKRGELELHYQPIVELASGRTIGVEALARWTDSERGPIGPDEFIPLAEQTGLIRPLSEWAIRRPAGRRPSGGRTGHDLHVSINLPPDVCRQIGAGAIVDMIEDGRVRPGADRARDDRVRRDGAAARAEGRDGGARPARHPARDRRLRHRPLVALPARRVPGDGC